MLNNNTNELHINTLNAFTHDNITHGNPAFEEPSAIQFIVNTLTITGIAKNNIDAILSLKLYGVLTIISVPASFITFILFNGKNNAIVNKP